MIFYPIKQTIKKDLPWLLVVVIPIWMDADGQDAIHHGQHAAASFFGSLGRAGTHILCNGVRLRPPARCLPNLLLPLHVR